MCLGGTVSKIILALSGIEGGVTFLNKQKNILFCATYFTNLSQANLVAFKTTILTTELLKDNGNVFWHVT